MFPVEAMEIFPIFAVPDIFAFPATMFPLPEIAIEPILIFAEEAMDIFPMLAVPEIFAFPATFKFPTIIFPVVSPVIIPVPMVMFPVEAIEIFPILAVPEIFALAVVKTPVEGL